MSTASNTPPQDQFWKHYFELQSLALHSQLQGDMFTLTVKNVDTGKEEEYRKVRFLPTNFGTKN